MKSKKSVIFDVLGIILGTLTAFGLVYINAEPEPKGFIGDKSLELLETVSEVEKSLYYTDQSSEYSTQQVIYDLARKGGFENKKCGDYVGYGLWSVQGKSIGECFPDYNENFKSLLNITLNKFLSLYPVMDLPLDNYDFNIEQKDNLIVIGEAKEKLNVPVFENDPEKVQPPLKKIASDQKECCICKSRCGNGCFVEIKSIKRQCKENYHDPSQLSCDLSYCYTEEVGRYAVKPSFKTEVSYNISVYETLKDNATKLIDTCKTEADVAKCVEDNKYIFNNDKLELIDCGKTDDEKIFKEFIDYFLSCSLSEDNGCYCADLKPSEGSFEIVSAVDGAEIKGKINGEEYSQKILGVEVYGNDKEFDLKKDKDKYFHKDYLGRITFPVPGVGDKCTMKKEVFNFCVRDKETQLFVYDEKDKETKLRDVVYRFALTIK